MWPGISRSGNSISGDPIRPGDLGIGVLFEHVRDSVVVADPADGRIVLWSKSAEALLGYTQSEAVGLTVEALIPSRLRDAHHVGMDRFQRTGHGPYVDAAVPLELPARRKDGTEIIVEMTLSTVRGPGIERPFVLAIIRDATDRKLAEEEHRRLLEEQAARAQAEATIRMRDEFVSVAAHELRTPLTALHGSIQVLERLLSKHGTLSVEELTRWLPVMEGQSRKLAILVSQLLDLPRIEAGRLHLDRRNADLVELVSGIVEMKQAETNRHRIVCRSAGPCEAMFDWGRMEQVLASLLDNAVKFSPLGGEITVDAQRNDSQVQVNVCDEGLGVAPEDRARIFDRFYRAHNDPGITGLGLGLYVSRHITEAHGGSLTAEFPDAGGSRFTVSIPIGGPPGP